MSVSMTQIKGGCHCGRSNFTVSVSTASLPLKAWICHCGSCRKAHGAIALLHVDIPAPDSAVISTLSVYKTSKDIERYFCPTCGCHPFEWDNGEHKWYVSTGIIQKQDFPVVEYTRHIFIQDTKDGGFSDWFSSLNGKLLKRWSLWPERSPELPLDWKSPESHPTRSDKLRAKCHCGGVEFYLSRPLFDSPEFTKDFPNFKVPSETVSRSKEHWFVANDQQKWIAGFCSCDSCRRTHGMEVMSWTYVPTSLITLADGSPHRLEFGTLKCYQSSPKVTRRFCGRCAATVFYQVDDRPNIIDVAVGLLESTAGVKAEDWLEWRKDDISWRRDARDPKLMEELLHGCQDWYERQKSA